MWLQIALAAIIVSFTAFYLYMKHRLSYWKRRGIPEDKGHFPFGSKHAWDFVQGKMSFTQMTNFAYETHPGEKVVGTYDMFGSPGLVIRDPDIAKLILVKDFENFMERKPVHYNMYDSNTKNNRYFPYMLTELRGQQWKNVRSSLTPVFTSGKLKNMIPLIHKVADNCETYLDKNIGVEFEAKELLKGYALDIIISTGFGYENDTLNNPENIFKKHADVMIGKTFSWKLIATILLFMICPRLLRWLDWAMFDKNTVDFFAALIVKTIKERKESGQRRNDLIDVCVDILEKERKENEKSVEDEEEAKRRNEEMEKIIIANSLIMFLAGFDTVSNASSLMIYFLAKHQDCQERLYQEIQEAIESTGSTNFDYATIMNMPYMEKFFQETFRMYPFTHLERCSKEEYKIPDTDIVIPKGIFVRYAATAVVKDEKYYPNPEMFDPENYSAEKKVDRHPFVTGAFGHGPRNCIAQRFATMEVKIVIARLLSKYKIVPCSKTVDELIPDPRSRSGQPKGDIWVTVEKR